MARHPLGDPQDASCSVTQWMIYEPQADPSKSFIVMLMGLGV